MAVERRGLEHTRNWSLPGITASDAKQARDGTEEKAACARRGLHTKPPRVQLGTTEEAKERGHHRKLPSLSCGEPGAEDCRESLGSPGVHRRSGGGHVDTSGTVLAVRYSSEEVGHWSRQITSTT